MRATAVRQGRCCFRSRIRKGAKVKMRWVRLAALVAMMMVATGCKSLCCSTAARTKSPWQNLEQIQCAYDDINTNKPTATDLRRLGFDPYADANIKVLNYLDIMQRFLVNPSIRKEDLPPG